MVYQPNADSIGLQLHTVFDPFSKENEYGHIMRFEGDIIALNEKEEGTRFGSLKLVRLPFWYHDDEDNIDNFLIIYDTFSNGGLVHDILFGRDSVPDTIGGIW